ncbi:hypothetical protein K435DRAFT_593291, partial [Dendrothele bispora CBS 962.96]
SYNPVPYHTSKLTGAEWVKELQDGHQDRMKNNLGIRRHVFRKLKAELQEEGELKPRRHVGTDEMIATFLF